jgi:hypothetical protein
MGSLFSIRRACTSNVANAKYVWLSPTNIYYTRITAGGYIDPALAVLKF